MTKDEKTGPLVRKAARVVIIGGIVAGVALVSTAGYFAWRHFAYQATVKRCTMGLPAETLMRMDARDARLEGTAEGPITRCFRDAGF
jgi:hypothetical protein